MLRALKFISFFLGITALIFLLVVGLNYNSFKSMFDNRYAMAEGSEWVEYTYSMSGLARYITENREMVSISSVTAGDEEASFHLGEQTPRPMGTLSNLFLMAGYAAAFEQGDIDPDRQIYWEDISKYRMPQIGEAVHNDAYSYGLNRGFIEDDGMLTIENALELLSRFNSLALSDYLLMHLGKEPVERLYQEMDLKQTDLPLPFSGIYITLASSFQDSPSDSLRMYWQSQPREKFEEAVYTNTRLFTESEYRSSWLKKFETDRLDIDFRQERDLLDLFPGTTSDEITRVLMNIRNGENFPPEAGERVMEWLRFPADNQTLSRNFTEYSALYDNRLGLLNGLDVGVSAETGETRIQAVFFDQIHIAVWFHMSSNHMHQDFQQRLIWDPALIETMKNAVQS